MKLFFPLFQLAGNVAGFVDLGEVDLWPDLGSSGFFPADGSAGFGSEVPANKFRLVLLNGRRVGLLLLDTNFRQSIQDFFALNFKLSGQIIDSNFHACLPSRFPVKRSCGPHACSVESIFLGDGAKHRLCS